MDRSRMHGALLAAAALPVWVAIKKAQRGASLLLGCIGCSTTSGSQGVSGIMTKRPFCPGVLVLEELEHAKARGAPILAEFLGGSCTCDAHHMTEPQPQGKGVLLCIQKCATPLAVPLTHAPAWGYYGRPALHFNVRRLYTCHVTTAVCMHAQAPAVHHLLTAQRAAYLLAVYCPVYYKFSNLPFPLSRTVLDLLTCIQRLWYSNVCTHL